MSGVGVLVPPDPHQRYSAAGAGPPPPSLKEGPAHQDRPGPAGAGHHGMGWRLGAGRQVSDPDPADLRAQRDE